MSSRQRGRTRRPVTSKDVAAEAGVSQPTVARTFGTPHLVAESTRRKVEAAAERLGYVPNAIARSLKSQRTNIIGAVVPAYGEYWQNVLTEFSRQLSDNGQQLLLFSFSDAGRVDDMLAIVAQYRLDGLLLASATIGPAQLFRMQETELPVVAFNQPAASGLVPSVGVDNAAGSASLARHLIELGCRSVCFVGGVAATSTDQLRYRGAAQELAGFGVACPYLEAGAFSYEAGYKAARRVLDEGPRPDAVMVASDTVAFGVIDGLASEGVRVPDDVLVTGFDGLPQASWTGYDLTTLVQPIDVLVTRAIELLGTQAEHGAAPARPRVADIVVPGTVRFGASTRRADG